MSAKKIITVFGATGAQGGSVVKSILGDSKMKEAWTVRGVTRDTTKPSAKALEALGAETVTANLNDAESVRAAIKGSYAVYGVTNFWESGDGDVEMAQGRAMADGAKEAGVQHLVWSSLPNVSERSNGGLTGVLHFDSKAGVEAYIRKIGVPATFFMPGFYMSNLPGGMFRQAPPSNDYTLALPVPASSPVPLLDTEDDTGKFVKGILLHRERVLGKRILGATEYLTLEEIRTQFQETFPEAGKTARNVELPHDVFKNIMMGSGRSDAGAEDLLQNMRLLNEYGYYFGESLDESLAILGEEPTTWKQYMKKAKAWANLK
ncbi:putative NmrA-like family domain-containing protein 1 [Amylocarpus encephaloides]|uniref:NmrA-like family domain-containing protein 1 n=1 Tax=Amylocarpus encephaloides TaxID=45428 RepID=A0A9P8C2P3_9HELO|nr:putative NmrA-like family domain-containing protein 1 [Amylocarpus encephaloides]